MLVPIPSLPSPRRQNATVLFVRCELQVSQSETLQFTSQPPPIKRSTMLHRSYTKRNFQSKSHSQKRDMLLTFTNPSDSHIFTVPQNVKPNKKTSALKKFSP